MKLQLDKELSRLDWFARRMNAISDDRYSITDTWDVNEVKESVQRNVDQGTSESFRDRAEGDYAGEPWIIVNGVTRRYGYTL